MCSEEKIRAIKRALYDVCVKYDCTIEANNDGELVIIAGHDVIGLDEISPQGITPLIGYGEAMLLLTTNSSESLEAYKKLKAPIIPE